VAALLMSGKELAEKFRAETAERAAKLAAEGLPRPGLAVVQVGDDPASSVYVRNKVKTSEKLGIGSALHKLPATASQAEVVELVRALNGDAGVTGVLVQLPLPAHINADDVICGLDPAKDVDCLHPANVGRLWLGNPFVKPCTPYGVMEMLRHYGVSLSGKRAVIVGRSNIVGKPLAALMLAENATVTVCHSRTENLPAVTREADVLVAAVGRPKMITAEYVKEGVAVVDVGVNRLPGEGDKEILVGDVDFAGVSEKASAITPVPGGVGPMTIAMLMVNTLACYDYQRAMR
jgi:methylenetetrahydrofolate dehydrogenase (NADP+)/methenyltetrahydrofolate cyclohydrolase